MAKSPKYEPGRSFGLLQRVPDSTEDGGEEGGDFKEESGVLFYVNRSGFPIDDKTWDRMWNHVVKIHPDGYSMTQKIKYADKLPEIPVPQAPVNFATTVPVLERVEAIQNYMNSLNYNHTGTQFFEIKKYRPLAGLMDTAKEMIREALPIKCLEAVILGIYLTNGTPGLERFPISFKSAFNGNIHRHVVLGLYYAGKFGALGMSRRNDLMYKPLVFKNLSSLILDYQTAYEKYWHTLQKVKVGMPVPHDSHSCEPLPWRGLTLELQDYTKDEMTRELDYHARDIKSQSQRIQAIQAVYGGQKMKISSLLDAATYRPPKGSSRQQSFTHSKSKKRNSSVGSPQKLKSKTPEEATKPAEAEPPGGENQDYQIRI